MDFLTYYVNFENPEMMANFEKEVEQLTGRTTTMGVKEILLDRAMKQGVEMGVEMERAKYEIERAKALEEKREMAKTFKNLGISILDIAKGTGLSVKEIEGL